MPSWRWWLPLRKALAQLSGDQSVKDQAFLAAAVEPAYYAQQVGLPQTIAQSDLVAHFLESGLAAGLSPSPLFPACEPSATPMRQRILESRAIGPAEGWFDSVFYLTTNPDVASSPNEAFEHFLLWGLREGRSPTPLWDPIWYLQSHRFESDDEQTPAFFRYLSAAPTRGHVPSLALLPIFSHRTASSRPEIERLGLVMKAALPWLRRLGPERFAFLIGLFHSHGYDGAGVLEADVDGPERLAHFLSEGLAQGLDPGPLFEAALYCPPDAPALSKPGAALLHFLEYGDRSAAPTRLIDEKAYRRRNADFPTKNFWAYHHFVRLGIFEGRPLSEGPRVPTPVVGADAATRALLNWRRFWSEHDPRVKLDGVSLDAVSAQRRLTDIFGSAVFQEVMRRALVLDPSIGDVSTLDVAVLPMSDPRAAARIEILKRLPLLNYDAIVCVPWLRNGSTDLIACLLADAISDEPSHKVLLLRCDEPHFERPDWVPAQVDVVHISDIVGGLSRPQAEEFFYTLLLGLAPRQVFNVDSNLCWRTFARYGARLSRNMDLYAYLFCWGYDAKGRRVGYPSDFFAVTVPHMATIFTDTEYLRDELFQMHLLPEEMRRRVVPLFSPVREMPSDPQVIAEVAAAHGRLRPRVVWAGRLDPQKRFDLVLDAARRMPDADFECWGSPVLSDAVEYDLPANLKLHGLFNEYEELRLHDADAWLFTSDGEGMPTLIIELGIRGTPIVASSVGGISELIDETTGFPVPGGSDAAAYVAALRQAIDDPGERIRRATRLQARTRARHTREAYLSRLTEILRWR